MEIKASGAETGGRLAEFRVELAELRAEFRTEITAQSAKIDMHHSELLMKFADLDRRLSAVERIR